MMKHTLALSIVGLSLAAVAMPTKKELKGVQNLVAELMASDLAAYKAGAMKAPQVAAKAEAYARDAETEAAKFLFLKGAFGFYMQGEEYGEALRVLNTLTTEVKDVPDKVMAEIVLAKLKKLSKSKGTEIVDYYERLELRMKMSEERAKLEKALKAEPKSKEIRRELAVCLAVLGDWPAALEHFAQVGGKEAEAAAAEKSGKRAAAADLWWDAAQGDAEDTFKSHAAALYRQAVAAGKIKGLKLTLVKKRIAEVAPEGGTRFVASENSNQPRPRQSAALPQPENSSQPRPRQSATLPRGRDVPVASSSGKYDWSIPENLTEIKTLDFDLGCPEKMTFVAVPGGESDGGFGWTPLWSGNRDGFSYHFKVTHPFWFSQIPVTYAQFKALGFEYAYPPFEKLASACAGDPEVAVLAPASYLQTERFLQILNDRFGRQLPNGYVFRLPTVAECSIIPKGRGFWGNRFGQELLPTLQKKGFLLNCQTEKDVKREFYKAFGVYSEFYCPELKTLKQFQLVNRFSADRKLDLWEVEDYTGRHYDTYVAGWTQAMKAGLKDENPFWYCDPSSPKACQFSLGVLYRIADLVKAPRRVSTIRVVVGYDYVGEWKRQHGVK